MDISTSNEEDKVALPHHEQQSLCTTRLPYRQGRKLTAVKVYTVNNESNHLLVFGIPSLKLRQEAKSLFSKFGKLRQFTITTDYPTEAFTENYHAVFESIQAARLAKKMLDTKNFYGGSLHICYAPELEGIDETRNKLYQRQKDVLNRLKNLEKEALISTKAPEPKPTIEVLLQEKKKLNMGEVNVIGAGRQIRDVVLNKNKRKNVQTQNVIIEKKFKPCFEIGTDDIKGCHSNETGSNSRNDNKNIANNSKIDIVDCTSTEIETISNINEALNYNKFGNEVIRKIPEKPVNRIKFNLGNKKI
ncbi:RNA-binding protein 48 [Pectinophora gossypiella]|uniref:RNA-binding protein 48 n=1 Tax=Pectinophora gossypiella TaxID=13191 RepID=UPI00214DFBB7|nr:RNA-binding protein 48 [Pectinophora gossypiella]